MQQSDSFREYLENVCEQIRWKKAHPVICRELGDHLEDERAMLAESGLKENDAEQQAVLDMGDAALVGTQLDRVYRPRPAWGIITLTVILMAVGLFARLYAVKHVDGLHTVDVTRGLIGICVATVTLVIGYFLDYSIIGKHPIMIAAGFAVTLLFLSLFASVINSAYRYIYIFGSPYAISNLLLLLPMVYAGILWWWPYRGYTGLIGAYFVLGILTMTGLFFSSSIIALVPAGICGLMLTAETLKGRFQIKRFCGLTILFSPIIHMLLWLLKNTSLAERIQIMIRPELDPFGSGFVGTEIRKVLDGARWIGSGSDSYTIDHLPEMWNNNMLTFFIHQFGWIALVIVLLLFGLLFAFSAAHIMKQRSRLGRMVSLSILLILAAQGSIYIVNNLGIVSISSIVLPLISNGNTVLAINAFLIGLMLSVFRNDDIVRDPLVTPRFIPRIKISIERLP